MIVREFDLHEVIDELEEEAEGYAASQADIEQEARGLMGESEEAIKPLRESWEALESKRVEAAGQAERFEALIDEYGGSTWKLKELTVGDAARIRDSTGVEVDIETGSFDTGMGAATTEMLRLSIKSAPPDAPDVVDYPALLAEVLNERIENLNHIGEVDSGNRSFGDVMESSTDSSQTSSTEGMTQTTSS